MLALAGDSESGFLKRAHGIEMIDAGNSRHDLNDLNLADVRIAKELVANDEVFADCCANVGERRRLGRRVSLTKM